MDHQNVVFWGFNGSSSKLAWLNLNNVDNDNTKSNSGNKNNNNNNNDDNNAAAVNNDDDDDDDDDDDAAHDNGSVQTVG